MEFPRPKNSLNSASMHSNAEQGRVLQISILLKQFAILPELGIAKLKFSQ